MNKDFLTAYSNLLNSIKPVKKDCDNPFYKSKYADLGDIFEEIKQKIRENGFVLLQNVERQILRTRIVHIETGEMLESTFDLITAKPDMQQMGGAVTYARRYSLLPMLNIECEDDDGNAASGIKKQSFDDLNTVAEFERAICDATSEKVLGALWYKWKDKFEKDSPEYKRLQNLSTQIKSSLRG
ncbi:MAG: ERF family protein [Oscillospiraceae bacterium]|nr:ERF family protein [Oscillospiraceae bacterium]